MVACKAVAKNDKEKYWDCLDRAMDASHGGRNEEALAWLDEALKARPRGAEAYNGRGEILWDEGRPEEALAQFDSAMRADPNFFAAQLNRAEILIEELGDYERAMEQCDRLLSGDGRGRKKGAPPRPERAVEAELYYLKSKALFYMEKLEGALFLARRALQTAGDVPVYRSFEGQVLFELGEFEAARRQLERALLMDPESPHTAYFFGLALERLGEAEEAARAFQQANALDAEHFPLPHPVSAEAFQAAAAEALDGLPLSIREEIENAPLLVEDYPSLELIRHENLSPQILGLFVGVPRTEAQPSQQAEDVTRMYLFKKNLERACGDAAELVEQIQVTVKHEVGHYLGFDEDDLIRLGLG